MRKILAPIGAFTLTLSLAVSAIVATPAQAAGCDVSSFAGGSGTEGSPFQISTAAQLANIEECKFDVKHFVMTTDINVASISPWITISNFIGNFDGADHEITNLNFSTSISSKGLFGYVEDATIRNVKVRGTANINSAVTAFGAVAAQAFRTTIEDIEVDVDITVPAEVPVAGGLVGYSDYTDVSNVKVSALTSGFTTSAGSNSFGGVVGSFNNGSMTNVDFEGDLSGLASNYQLGGVVGYVTDSELVDLTATGDVSGLGDFVSGIAGYLSVSSLTGAIHTGDVRNDSTTANSNIAGIAGYGSGSAISDVSQIGEVFGADTSGQSFVGGIVSYLSNSMSVDSSLSDATVTGDVTGTSHVGGIVGNLGSHSPISNVSVTGEVAGENYVGGIAGYQNSNISDASYTGVITSASNAGGVSGYCAGGFGMDENFNFVTTFREVTNIEVNATITTSDGNPDDFTWLPTGGLIGYASSCNVTNATVTGAVVGETFLGGAIGYASEGAFNGIKTRVVVTSTGESVGGLVGYASDLTINDSFAIGAVTGRNTIFGSVGGFLGYGSGIVATRIFHTGDVVGVSAVGGLFGRATDVTVTDGYAIGNITHDPETEYPHAGLIAGSVSGITLTRVYASGAGTDSRDLDIFGMGSGELNSVIQDSTADATIGDYTSVLLRTNTEMKLAKTYRDQDWDFPTVWMMNAPTNNGMPMLRSLSVPSDCKVRNFSPVLFKKGSAKLSAKAKTNLTKFANQIAFGPCRNLKISGYTSTYEIGKKLTPVSKLKKLAGQRAQAVKKYLRTQLVALGDTFTFTVSIRHKLSPIGNNKKIAGQAKNRRVVAGTIS